MLLLGAPPAYPPLGEIVVGAGILFLLAILIDRERDTGVGARVGTEIVQLLAHNITYGGLSVQFHHQNIWKLNYCWVLQTQFLPLIETNALGTRIKQVPNGVFRGGIS